MKISSFVTLIVLIATPLVGLPALAIVSMANLNYSDQFDDFVIDQPGASIHLFRVYNSRSGTSGMFGSGWCSRLEDALWAVTADQIGLQVCNQGSIQTFTRETAVAPVDDRALQTDRILRLLEEQGRSADMLADARSRLTGDPGLFREFSRQLGQEARPLPVGRFAGAGSSLVVSEHQAILTESDRMQRVFDRAGRLIRIVRPDGRATAVDRIGSSRLRLWSGPEAVELVLDPLTKLVMAMEHRGKLIAEYAYEKRTGSAGPSYYLVNVLDGWGDRYLYRYGPTNQLSRITMPDATYKEIYYDPAGLVSGFRDRAGCTEAYSAGQDPNPPIPGDAFVPIRESFVSTFARQLADVDVDDPEAHFSRTLEKSCDGLIEHVSYFEWWYGEAAVGAGRPVVLSLQIEQAQNKTGVPTGVAIAYAADGGEVFVSKAPLYLPWRRSLTTNAKGDQLVGAVSALGRLGMRRSSVCERPTELAGALAGAHGPSLFSLRYEHKEDPSGRCSINAVSITLHDESFQFAVLPTDPRAPIVIEGHDLKGSIGIGARDFVASCVSDSADQAAVLAEIRGDLSSKCTSAERAALLLAALYHWNFS